MQKTIVGNWGSELDDAGYACALAALGVLESRNTRQHPPSSDPVVLARALQEEFESGDRTPVWRGAYNPHIQPPAESWRQTRYENAAALAAAWWIYKDSISEESQRPRLAIDLFWRDHSQLFKLDELSAWLNHPAVGLDGLVWSDSIEFGFARNWHWPLRVGVPLGSEDFILAALQSAEDGRLRWLAELSLSQCYTVGGSRDSCDLLILPINAAEEILSQPRTRLRARFVALLDDPPSSHVAIPDSFRVLRSRLHAAGVAAIGRVENLRDLKFWFTLIMQYLSRDVPIHVAVWAAGRVALSRAPLIVGNPRRLDDCRVLALAKRLDYVAQHKSGGELQLPSPDSPRAPSPAKPPPRRRVRGRTPTTAGSLRERIIREPVEGKTTEYDLIWSEQEIERTRDPRWIQTNAWRPDAPEPLARSLAPKQWNLLTVHIGPTQQPRSDAPFPERFIDFSQGNVPVTVQLELYGADLTPLEPYPATLNAELVSTARDRQRLMEWLRAEQPDKPDTDDPTSPIGLASAEITLPLVGDSTLAVFGVRPHEHVTDVEGRIAIIHNNRILQTARLAINTNDTPDEGSGLIVVAEAPLHPRYDDLRERREYDVAILVSDIGAKLHLTIQHNDTVTPVQLDNLGGPISDLRKALEAATLNWDHSKSVFEQETFPKNLYTLSAIGSSLEQHLRKRCGDAVKEWERIHLVPATNEFLPLEYMYDGPPPDVDAQVCPHMLGALERESCAKALETSTGISACPNQQNDLFVCPMHFWGFRKLIERSGTVSPPSGTQPAKVCVPSKQPYGKLRAMLFAASDRAFLYEDDPEARLAARAAFVKELGEISTVSEAADWKAWRQEVAKKPNLLLLVVHAEKYKGVPSLEIGDQKFLGRQQILQQFEGATGHPQLLILLGCSVAQVSENFQPYPETFRDAGVSIVLAPVATIRGADAVPIAKRIVQVVGDRLARPEPTGFGELLPLLRRELLRKGHPGVMGVVGFGDGDWLLGGQ